MDRIGRYVSSARHAEHGIRCYLKPPMTWRVLQGDCIELMRELEPESIDAIVTDPPYGLGFMGKAWDALPPGLPWAQECLRVLKPGGHLLAFGGTRTYHRLAVAIEDAGFEIRDTIAWMYGSGFPKSQNVSKAIDKAAGAERKVIGQAHADRYPNGPGGTSFGVGNEPDGTRTAERSLLTAPATPEAQQWEGWGTALKPAHEPIVVARKPLIGTVAQNVLEHGTGAVNIDATRIAGVKPQVTQGVNSNPSSFAVAQTRQLSGDPNEGRWPANVVLDRDAADMLDKQTGHLAGASKHVRAADVESAIYGGMGKVAAGVEVNAYGDSGGASRFFYVAKASKAERGEGNNHPTVKPVAVMQWLVRLVTPPGGLVLDPFLGSGTTGIAALREGFSFLGMEREPAYTHLAIERIAGRHISAAKEDELYG